MNKRHRSAASGLAVGALVVSGLALPMQAQALPGTGAPPSGNPARASRTDNFPNTLGDAQQKLTQDAVKRLVTGEASTTTIKGNRVIKVDSKNRKGQPRYVNDPVEREEDIFTVLVDFGTKTKTAFGGTPGPVHNNIPAPDRNWDGNATDDDSTYWVDDFDRAHYQDLMFGEGESFKDFYLKQSNGRFLAKGDVSDWVSVPYNEAAYGSNKISEANYWLFVQDSVKAWYDQVAQHKSAADIKAYLAQFDKVDRYDFDHDGVFNEPDGYIDHFQAIHAGEGEEAGGGAQGEDAIWSHRWYAFDGYTDRGPAANKNGGVPIGDSGLWVGEYTTEPWNGGLGVFAHEFGHDLGLPDLYDTAGGDNGTGFWTLMSGGSWLNRGGDSIGTTPGYMGPWEKLQLGWLDHKTIPFGEDQNIKLGRSDMGSSKGEQAAVIPLPERTVVTEHNKPHSGAGEWWTGVGNDLSTTLTRDVDLSKATTADVSFHVSGNIEVGYDTLRGEVSTNGGITWTTVGGPVDGSADDAVKEEDNDLAWTKLALGGFQIINGTTSCQVQDMYLVENRTYGGYDDTLRTGPYNFGWSNTTPDWVERLPYPTACSVSRPPTR